MIEEVKFKKGFKFHKGMVEYEVLSEPTDDHPVYRVMITDHRHETCLVKYLTYPEVVYIMFNAE